jgi:Tol biopolymer transport system component
VIIGGPETDTSPRFSGLGTRILFRRTASGSTQTVLMADADGSDVRQLIGVPSSTQQHLWWDWSADGRRLIYPKYELPIPRTLILDTVTGTTTEPHPGVDQHYAMWRPGHDEYVFRSSESGRLRYFLASADGPDVREIAIPDGGLFGLLVSPDGSTLVYVPGDGSPGPLHALDIDTGHDRLLTQPGDGYEWSNPQFSPDGTQILAERHPAPANGTSDVVAGMDSLVLLPVDGAGPIQELSLPSFADGPPDDALVQFSPDGKSVLANFGDTSTSWLLDTTGGPARPLDMPYPGGSAWQRLAP